MKQYRKKKKKKKKKKKQKYRQGISNLELTKSISGTRHSFGWRKMKGKGGGF